jgi:hypothetical protein
MARTDSRAERHIALKAITIAARAREDLFGKSPAAADSQHEAAGLGQSRRKPRVARE